MNDDEMCPLFPSLRKMECSHCRGTAPGTSDNPVFSLEESIYKGFHVVEVLKDGGPIHIGDRHFKFGRRKAQIMIGCINALRDFWQSTDEQRISFPTKLIEDERGRLRIQVYV